MSWVVEVKSNQFSYRFEGEEFSSEIFLREEKFSKEKSSGYQEPDDDVLNSVFYSETEHGYFEWSVRSARTGYNSYAEIEDESLTSVPKEIEDWDEPKFVVVND